MLLLIHDNMRSFRLTGASDADRTFLHDLVDSYSTRTVSDMKGFERCVWEFFDTHMRRLSKQQSERLDDIVRLVVEGVSDALQHRYTCIKYGMLKYTENGRVFIHSDYPEVKNDLSVSVNLSHPADFEGGDLVTYKSHLRIDTLRRSRWHLSKHTTHVYAPECLAPRGLWVANCFDSRTLHEIKRVESGTRVVLVLWLRE